MEAMRATWTDERLDDLKGEVVEIRQELARQGARIDGVGERIDRLTQAIIVVGGSLLAAFIAFSAAIVGVLVTQL
jgi:hypothetical protein